ncbi:MAG: hypothetical protein OSB65_03085 [Roseibacillus sp.]|jgi:hypothetical protein|nr:hypothetical protein [Roseibacillus sp.]
MSNGEVIKCKPTKWFFVRAIAMVTMFAVFLVLFLKDWKVGWPKKNEIYYTFQAFKKAGEAFAAHEGSAEGWNSFASAQKIEFPDEKGMIPVGVDSDASWPAILADYSGYKKALAKEGSRSTPPLWTVYTDERGWSSAVPNKFYGQGKIKEQLYFGIGSGFLMIVGGFYLARTSRRSMRVDGEAYYAPSGERIPYDSIKRIDKRKWETKGLAYLTYVDGKEEKKAKVDGMVYGQFKPEDDAPAEALFKRILSNFLGELIELEEDEDEEECDEAVASSAEEGGDSSKEVGEDSRPKAPE